MKDTPNPDAIREMRKNVKAQVRQERSKFQTDQAEKKSASGETASDFSPDKLWNFLRAEQDGDAALFVSLQRGKFLHDHSEGSWNIFGGHFFKLDTVGEAIAAVQTVIDTYEAEAARLAWSTRKSNLSRDAKEQLEKRERAFRARVAALQKLDRKRAVLTLAASGKRGLSTAGEAWDSQPMLLPCANGVLDLETGKLRDGMPSDMLRTSSPTAWTGLEVQAPIFGQFLRDIFNGDSELIAYMQRLLGYTITGIVSDHVFPIFWGNGRNGKGTLLETLQFVLGLLAGPVKSELLLDQGRARGSGSPDADLMTLRGKRFVWASETDEGRKLSASRVKWLVGGDTIVARPPFGRREIAFRPTHKLLMLTNHKPRVDASDFALWQRIHLVPFNISFVDEPSSQNECKIDRTLSAKLKVEAPGILAWLVRGCMEWQKIGLKPPAAVTDATGHYRKAEDVLQLFLDEKCVVGNGFEVVSGSIYKAYLEWCSVNGFSPLRARSFGERMRSQFDSYKNNTNRYLGVGLLQA